MIIKNTICHHPLFYLQFSLQPFVFSLSSLCNIMFCLHTNMAKTLTTNQTSFYQVQSGKVFLCCCFFFFGSQKNVWLSFRVSSLIQLDCCVIVFSLSGDSLQSFSFILKSREHQSNKRTLWETQRLHQEVGVYMGCVMISCRTTWLFKPFVWLSCSLYDSYCRTCSLTK